MVGVHLTPLPAVVVRRYFVVIQEGDQFLAVAPQPLLQPSGVLLLPFLVDELVKTLPDSGLPPFVDFQRHTLFVFLQPHATPDQAAKLPVKLRSVLVGIVGVPSPAHVSQQVGNSIHTQNHLVQTTVGHFILQRKTTTVQSSAGSFPWVQVATPVNILSTIRSEVSVSSICRTAWITPSTPNNP